MNLDLIESKIRKGIAAKSIGVKHQMLCEALAELTALKFSDTALTALEGVSKHGNS